MIEKDQVVSSFSELTIWGGQGQRKARASVLGHNKTEQCCVGKLLLTAPFRGGAGRGDVLPRILGCPGLWGELIRFSWSEKIGTSEQNGMGSDICHCFSSVVLAHFLDFVAIVAILIGCYQIFI